MDPIITLSNIADTIKHKYSNLFNLVCLIKCQNDSFTMKKYIKINECKWKISVQKTLS